VLRVAKRLNYTVKTQVLISEGIHGLRVWRLK
jgi:hypothetical protein